MIPKSIKIIWQTKDLALIGYIFLLPFNEKLSSFFLALATVNAIVNYQKCQFNVGLFSIVCFYLSLLSLDLLNGDFLNSITSFERKLSFVVLPFIFSTKQDRPVKYFLRAFVLGCMAAGIFLLTRAIYLSIGFMDGSVVFDYKVESGSNETFFNSVLYGGNYFLGEVFTPYIQTVYFALYQTVSFLFVLWFGKKEFPKYYRIILFALGLFILLSLSKAGILSALCGVFIYFIFKKKWMILLLLFITSLILLKTNPRIDYEIKNINNVLNPKNDTEYGSGLRIISWKSSWDLIKKRTVFGYGHRKAEERLQNYYSENGFIWAYKFRLNAHNQFLQTMLENGLIGLIFLLGMFCLIFWDRTHPFFIAVLFVLLFNMMFESVFNRYVGVTFYVFLLGLVSISNKKNLLLAKHIK